MSQVVVTTIRGSVLEHDSLIMKVTHTNHVVSVTYIHGAQLSACFHEHFTHAVNPKQRGSSWQI